MDKGIILIILVIALAFAALFTLEGITGAQQYNKCSALLTKYIDCLEKAEQVNIDPQRCEGHWTVYESCAAKQ